MRTKLFALLPSSAHMREAPNAKTGITAVRQSTFLRFTVFASIGRVIFASARVPSVANLRARYCNAKPPGSADARAAAENNHAGAAFWQPVRRLALSPGAIGLTLLGVANLLGGLALGAPGAVSTRTALEALFANFAPFAWALVLWASTVPARTPRGATANAACLGVVACGALALGALSCVGYQLLVAPTNVNPWLYLSGVGFIAWSTLQLAALITSVQAILGKRHLGAAAAGALALGANWLFEHPLIRFGAPMGAYSEVAGYEPELPRRIAAGLYWSGWCALLLVGGERLRRRRAFRHGALATWFGAVICALSAAWLLQHQPPDERSAAIDQYQAMPRPLITRLDVAVDFDHVERRVSSRGALVVRNAHNAAIAMLRFNVPERISIRRLALTGTRVASSDSVRSYRLNRPLEPGETLKIVFDLRWQEPRYAPAPKILATRAAIAMGELVPRLLGRDHADEDPRVDLRALLSTDLRHQAIAPGRPTEAWRENGRQFYRYRSETPVSLRASLHSGRYETTTIRWRQVTIAAHHRPACDHCAPLLLALAKEQLDLSSTPTSHRQRWYHVVETHDHRPIARPLSLLAFGWRRVGAFDLHAEAALTGVLTVSERFGFGARN